MNLEKTPKIEQKDKEPVLKDIFDRALSKTLKLRGFHELPPDFRNILDKEWEIFEAVCEYTLKKNPTLLKKSLLFNKISSESFKYSYFTDWMWASDRPKIEERVDQTESQERLDDLMESDLYKRLDNWLDTKGDYLFRHRFSNYYGAYLGAFKQQMSKEFNLPLDEKDYKNGISLFIQDNLSWNTVVTFPEAAINENPGLVTKVLGREDCFIPSLRLAVRRPPENELDTQKIDPYFNQLVEALKKNQNITELTLGRFFGRNPAEISQENIDKLAEALPETSLTLLDVGSIKSPSGRKLNFTSLIEQVPLSKLDHLYVDGDYRYIYGRSEEQPILNIEEAGKLIESIPRSNLSYLSLSANELTESRERLPEPKKKIKEALRNSEIALSEQRKTKRREEIKVELGGSVPTVWL